MVFASIAKWMDSEVYAIYFISIIYDMREFPFKTQLIGFHMSLPKAFDALMG